MRSALLEPFGETGNREDLAPASQGFADSPGIRDALNQSDECHRGGTGGGLPITLSFFQGLLSGKGNDAVAVSKT